MRLFDENGTFVGEFIEATEEMIDHTKEVVSDKFSDSIFLGILCLIIAPGVDTFGSFLNPSCKNNKIDFKYSMVDNQITFFTRI